MASNLPTPLNQAQRNYLEPIGPPTQLINPAPFLAQAALVHQRTTASLNTLNALLASSGVQDAVLRRCSVKDLEDGIAGFHSNENRRMELRKWHEDRLFPAGHGVVLDDDAPPPAQDDDDPGPDLDTFDSTRRRKVIQDGELKVLLAEVETSRLGIVRPIKDLPHFLRKTKVPDYNILPEIRSTRVSNPADPAEPLSSLLYTITFHAIPRVTSRTSYPTVAQTLHCQGSTTLWELRENLSVGGEAVPAQLEDEEDEDVEEEDDKQEWNSEKKPPKWGQERRVAGSVFGLEGLLHADTGAGQIDYSEMIVSAIESTDWSLQRPRVNSPDEDIDVNIADQDQTPAWKVGTTMRETKLGELKIRIGEPYWYMHQGNCEHVWTVDEIRYAHPLDPPTGYPLTTFLSRNPNEGKCGLCDRDPGSIVTLNDELAGESPALLCQTCFTMLHGANEDNHVIVVPTLLEP